MKKLENRWILVVCVMLGVWVAACEKPKPPVKEPQNRSSAVVSKTIPQKDAQQSTEAENRGGAKNPLPAQNGATPETDSVPGVVNLPGKADAKVHNGDAAKNVLGPVPEVSVKLENEDMHDSVLMPPDTEAYVAKSMLDPFQPLIQEKKEIPAPEIEKPEKPQRILTPLEKMELSQIKLVAVVIMDDRKIAMVEEATGKGYEVDIGTYMGKNGGQVVDITFDTVVVKEMVTDYKGNQTERIREINMQKNDSGE